jgi:hypothetical protein
MEILYGNLAISYDISKIKKIEKSVLPRNREIGRTFFWFLTSYRVAEIVQNDYLSSA